LLGSYENFPEVVHGDARFTCKSSTTKVQQAVLSALHHLNQEVCSLSTVIPYSLRECEVSFEIGVAEDFNFIFLDNKELDRFQRSIVERNLPTLDFFCVVRYHVATDGKKRVPLKFDYHMLRFLFQEHSLEILICHERGTQRVPIESLIRFITNRINDGLSQNRLERLTLRYLRTL
jgi:hypothetical protein